MSMTPKPIRSGWPTDGATQPITKDTFLRRYCLSGSVTKTRAEDGGYINKQIEVDFQPIFCRLCCVPPEVMIKFFNLQQIKSFRLTSKTFCDYITKILEEKVQFRFKYSDLNPSIDPKIKEKFNFAIHTNIRLNIEITVADILEPQSEFDKDLHSVLGKKLDISMCILTINVFYRYILKYILYLHQRNLPLENLCKDIEYLQKTFDEAFSKRKKQKKNDLYKFRDCIKGLSAHSMFLLNKAAALKYLMSSKFPSGELGYNSLSQFIKSLDSDSALVSNDCDLLKMIIHSKNPRLSIINLGKYPKLLSKNSVLLHNNGESFKIILAWEDPGYVFGVLGGETLKLLNLDSVLFLEIVKCISALEYQLLILRQLDDFYNYWSNCPTLLANNGEFLRCIIASEVDVRNVFVTLFDYPKLLSENSVLFLNGGKLFREILSSKRPEDELLQLGMEYEKKDD